MCCLGAAFRTLDPHVKIWSPFGSQFRRFGADLGVWEQVWEPISKCGSRFRSLGANFLVTEPIFGVWELISDLGGQFQDLEVNF